MARDAPLGIARQPRLGQGQPLTLMGPREFVRMDQEERLARYKSFKEGHKRILVATDLVARGIDIERVNIVINYDMPDGADTYLHRVGRAGRFGTKGLALTFIGSDEDSAVLDAVHERFEVEIKELPEQIDTSTYMPA